MTNDVPVHPMLDWTTIQIADFLENSEMSVRTIGEIEYITLEEIPLEFIRKAVRALRNQPV